LVKDESQRIFKYYKRIDFYLDHIAMGRRRFLRDGDKKKRN
jgi:hypothetical protein